MKEIRPLSTNKLRAVFRVRINPSATDLIEDEHLKRNDESSFRKPVVTRTRVSRMVFTALMILSMLTVQKISYAEVIDRIVAVVDNHIITLSDVESESRFQGFLDTKAIGITPSPAEEKSVLFNLTQKLIEQYLIRQQIEQFPGIEVTQEEIRRQLEALRNQHSAEDWNALLARLKTTTEEIEKRLEWQIHVVKFIDYRFGQFIVVTPKELEDYYSEQVLPKVPPDGYRPTLESLEDEMREILTEEKLDEEILGWLEDLRETATIEMYY